MDKERTVTIPAPEDFSFEECSWFLDRNYDDCLHKVKDGEIVKALRLEGQAILTNIRAGKGNIRASILLGAAGEQEKSLLRDHIISWFDLERDLSPFYALLEKDSRLEYMTSAYRGLRLVGITDLFEALCWSVIGQQINLKFAYSLKRRLVEQYGTSIEYEGMAYHLFPGYQDLAGASVAALRAMQFSESKARYLLGLAEVFARGDLSREILDALPDLESRQKALMKQKGIGIWTSNYCLMKTLREPSCIPHGDTGLLTALANHGIIKERSEEAKIRRFFSRYPGWESYLVFYLWRSLSEK